MAKITRKTQKIFGSGAGGTGITKFGSVAAGAVAYSTDIAEIQNTTAWTNGWLAAVLSGAKLKPTYMDVNAVDYTFSQQLANIFQDGIPVFDIGTEYHSGCVCRKDTTTELYKSLVDTNSGNLLTDDTKWGFLCDLSSIDADKLDGYHASELISPNTGFISGLISSNNDSDANNDIDISAGKCRNIADDGNIILSSGITKRLDASFATGTNQGGLDTGDKAINTWYYLWAISKTDGTSDVLFSESSTAPTMPSGYVNKRRIGSIKTNSSGNIIAFKQNGDNFFWAVQSLDVNGSTTTSRTLYTLSIPAIDCLVFAHISCYALSGTQEALITSPYQADTAPSGLMYNAYSADNTHWSPFIGYVLAQNSQIGVRSTTSTSATLIIQTLGWIDTRGK